MTQMRNAELHCLRSHVAYVLELSIRIYLRLRVTFRKDKGFRRPIYGFLLRGRTVFRKPPRVAGDQG
jgi:hypothetical protein